MSTQVWTVQQVHVPNQNYGTLPKIPILAAARDKIHRAAPPSRTGWYFWVRKPGIPKTDAIQSPFRLPRTESLVSQVQGCRKTAPRSLKHRWVPALRQPNQPQKRGASPPKCPALLRAKDHTNARGPKKSGGKSEGQLTCLCMGRPSPNSKPTARPRRRSPTITNTQPPYLPFNRAAIAAITTTYPSLSRLRVS